MTLQSSTFHDTIFQAWKSIARRGPRLSRRPICDRRGRRRDLLFGRGWICILAARLHFGSSYGGSDIFGGSWEALEFSSSLRDSYIGSSCAALEVGSSWGVLDIGSSWGFWSMGRWR